MDDLRIPLLDLVSCFSGALDMVSPSVMNHHKRVAYLALRLAETVGLPRNEKVQIVLASLVHDIGLLSLHNKLDALHFEINFDNYGLRQHGTLGESLLRKYMPLPKIAALVSAHHVYWQDRDSAVLKDDILFGSQIIHLADRIDVLIDKTQEILSQVPRIVSQIEGQSGRMFSPELVAVFKHLAPREYLWLDLISAHTDSIIAQALKPDLIRLNRKRLLNVAKLFCQIIDFRSPFTATHSAGVAASAEALSRRMGFSNQECFEMRIAGYLHDLGKLAIPVEILEKPANLTKAEVNIIKSHPYHGYRTLEKVQGLETINRWGTLHHERLDGNGYPFHLRGPELDMGSRIMAVADIFTALMEDRPYRAGMPEEQALRTLIAMSESGAIDSEVVAVLRENLNEVDSIRDNAQQAAAEEYQKFRAVENAS